jgi:outer membrane biogenesis lipoprotein LolB
MLLAVFALLAACGSSPQAARRSVPDPAIEQKKKKNLQKI